MVREGFDDNTLVLTQANGCRFEDTELTRGMKENYVVMSYSLKRGKTCIG